MRVRGRLAWVLVGAATVVSVAPILAPAVSTEPAAAASDPVVLAAGDIACDPTDSSFNAELGTATKCRQRYTSDLLVSNPADAVITLGDNQYNSGSLSQFQQSYDPSWGRVKAITKPAIGNHEGTSATSGAGYCTYFGAAAACNASGRQGDAAFYSWNVGTWHMIALNSNCAAAGGCDIGSPQYTWLQNDLAANPATCTMAYWHHPRFSSGHDGSNLFMQPIWKLLHVRGADLVLSGHSHDYERFAPMDGDGNLNAEDGMRSMVVGTGGAFFTGLGTTAPNSVVRNNDTFGVMKLALHPTGYDWNFMPEAGRTFTDAGTGTCRNPVSGADTEIPTAPTALSAQAPSPTEADLSWAASNDNVGVAGYEIWRGPAGAATAWIATTAGTGTTYADTTATAGQSYDYKVRARDAAGNLSLFSNVASVTVPNATGTFTLTFAASDDATIDASNPTTALGTGNRITVDSSPINDLLVKFTVGGTGPGTACPTISGAKLRLTVGNGSTDNSGAGGDFRAAVDSNWSESTVNWNTAPAASAGSPVASIVTPVALGTAYLVDVTPIVTGNATLTIRANGISSDGARYYSRNGNAATVAPELQVTCTDGTGGDTASPTTPGTPAVTAVTTTTVGLAWAASTDNVGVTGYRVFRDGTQVGATDGSTTVFDDAGLAPATTYVYTVQAVDAATNASAPSGNVSATTSTASTLTFAASDDATIDASNPTTALGIGNRITVDSTPSNDLLVKFTVSGTGPGTGCPTIIGAKLRLTVGNGSTDKSGTGGEFRAAVNSDWSESTVNWNTAPAASAGSPVASIVTPVALGTAYLVDVTPIVTGDATITIRASGNSGNAARYYSRNGNAATVAPELQVTCG